MEILVGKEQVLHKRVFCHRCATEIDSILFCTNCGVKIRRNTQSLALCRFRSEKEAICRYFCTGWSYQAIVNSLQQQHGISMSLRTLKEDCQNMLSWHADGYAKLKPYGLPIHGAIDGFSRRIIWLKVVRTNNNPVVPASMYINVVKELGKCPTLLQTDCGTENGLMAAIQCTLLHNINVHRYGKSIANQRIENWWSHYRRGYSDWVIDFFFYLVWEGDLLVGNNVHMECVWFVFSQLLQSARSSKGKVE